MACEDGNADIVKRLEVQVKELRQVIEDNKDIVASELKSLKNEIESDRKENLEILRTKKEVEKKHEVFEKYAKQEMKSLTDEIKSIRKEIIGSNKDLEKNNQSLEEFVKKEIKNLHSNLDKVEVFSENLKESLKAVENNPKDQIDDCVTESSTEKVI